MLRMLLDLAAMLQRVIAETGHRALGRQRTATVAGSDRVEVTSIQYIDARHLSLSLGFRCKSECRLRAAPASP
ncbi:hypothetical protein B0T11DRAFT_277267 [Plectosphaerella cucumerina]|uniref:Uncharacterized protein n=1 Tax=Plectosphaerella cucumerina TaxID=40658 RepID=A0A8K0TJA6_9PEZI|nr:hypothetical protein B0T11DRAFT_277267 [Plectosphaerella cucumerina]